MKSAQYIISALITLFIVSGIVMAVAASENVREIATFAFYTWVSSGLLMAAALGKVTTVDLS